MTVCKKDDSPSHQKSRFFIASEREKKILEILITDYVPDVRTSYKRNPLITAVVNGSIF